jgi:threonine aldolase
MRFASDNRAGLAPAVLDAIASEGAGFGGAYGEDDATDALTNRMSEVFEREVTVFPLLTGTAANSLALACCCDPWGAVLCHRDAHIAVDECGAPEFFGGGLRLVPDEGDGTKLDVDTLRARLAAIAAERNDVHQVPLQALSITNLSELGRAYTPQETAAICDLARSHGLATHLDGARFANAVVATGATPADLTWRAGVDVMSFGATKNGALAAEAVVFFDASRAGNFERHRKRAGQLLSKMRFVSVQLLASLTDGRWLDWARHANSQTAALARGLADVTGVTQWTEPDGNELFVLVDPTTAERWKAGGAEFYGSPAGDQVLVRLVTSFATTDDEVASFLDLAANVAHQQGAVTVAGGRGPNP